MSPISRRRFIAGLAAGVGLGAAGVTWLVRPGSAGIAPATGTTLPTTSTLPPVPVTTSARVAPASTTTTATTTTTTTTTAPVAVVAIPVLCREAWGALPPAGDFTPHQIERITVHHTAVLLEENALAPSRVRQHQSFHQGRGWPDLAYHFMIDAAGNVYEGRPIDAVGDTGTEYDPSGHFLVCCEGNFDEQEIAPDQYATLVQLVAWGCQEFSVAPEDVRGHRDVAATSCPGDDLYSRIDDLTLAHDVLRMMEANLRLDTVCGDEGKALVAAIETSA